MMSEIEINDVSVASQPEPTNAEQKAIQHSETGVAVDRSYTIATPFSRIADKVTGNNPTAILLFNMCDAYQQEIKGLISENSIQSEKYQRQIDRITEAFQNQIKDIEIKMDGKETKKDEKIIELNKEIDDLIVANLFCKKLTPVNLFGSVLTLLGTVVVGIAVNYDNWWLIVIFCILSVLGSLLPTLFLYLSQIRKKTKQL